MQRRRESLCLISSIQRVLTISVSVEETAIRLTSMKGGWVGGVLLDRRGCGRNPSLFRVGRPIMIFGEHGNTKKVEVNRTPSIAESHVIIVSQMPCVSLPNIALTCVRCRLVGSISFCLSNVP